MNALTLPETPASGISAGRTGSPSFSAALAQHAAPPNGGPARTLPLRKPRRAAIGELICYA